MKKSPAFRFLRIFIKLIIFFLVSIAALIGFYGGYDLTTWYPTFIDIRMGAIMMVLSVVLLVFSFLVFKKKIFFSVFLIIIVALSEYGTFVYDLGFGRYADKLIVIFLVALVIFSSVHALVQEKR